MVGSLAAVTQSWLVSSAFPALWQGMVRYCGVQDLDYTAGEPVEMVVTWELDSYRWLESGPLCLPCSHGTHPEGEHWQRVKSRTWAMRNSPLGGLWVGWRTRLGLVHHGSGEGEQKAEIALQFQLFWHDMLWYSLLGEHTTGTVGLMWSVKVLSLCSRVRCSQNRRNSKTCIMELKGLRKYSEQRCSKTSHKLNFLLDGEYLEEHLNAVSVGLISDYSSFCCTCFLFFKLVSLT